MQFAQRNFGVSTSRQSSILAFSDSQIHFVLNCSLVAWDVGGWRRTASQQLHSSVVTCVLEMVNHKDCFLTLSEEGEVAVWRAAGNGYQSAGRARTNCPQMTFGSYCPAQSLLVAFSVHEGEPRRPSEVSVFRITGSLAVEPLLQTSGPFAFGWPDSRGTVTCFDVADQSFKFVERERGGTVGGTSRVSESPVYDVSINLSASQLALLYCRDGGLVVVGVNDVVGRQQRLKGLFGEGRRESPKYAIAALDDQLLMAVSDNGLLAVWRSADGQFGFWRLFDVVKGHVYDMKLAYERLFLATSSELVCYDCDWPGEALVFRAQSACHQITCSAVSVCEALSLVCSVDFAGNVLVWHFDQPGAVPLWAHRLEGSLRAVDICATSQGKALVTVGCLGGLVTCLLLGRSTQGWSLEQQRVVARLEGGIICLRREAVGGEGSRRSGSWELDERLPTSPNDIAFEPFVQNAPPPINDAIPKSLLVVGTASGFLGRFVQTDFEALLTRFVFQAHQPMKDYFDDRFGSLQHFAEIWAVALSPDKSHTLSTSEDQTAVVWDESGTKVHTFVGHAAPVTSADWRTDGVSGKEMVVTCGDDQRVLIWLLNEKEQRFKRKWVMLRLFESGGLGLDWHTLTYARLAVRKGRPFAVVGTQIGYLLIWDVYGRELVLARKVQYGSIEGLEVAEGPEEERRLLAVSCSGDCTVSLVELALG